MRAKLARGCRDVYAASARKRHGLVSKFSELAKLYGCAPIETPILEPASLYASLGATSDINVSETYRLVDTDPELVLRPEGTAGVARALKDAVKSSCHAIRVWYAGPMFRRERPQAGRFRQFTQIGVEFVDGTREITHPRLHPLADADAISLMYKFFTSIGIYPTVRLNTLGTAIQRANFNDSLVNYLTPRRKSLSKLSQQRLDSGTCIRILDSKNNQDIETLQNGPSLREFQNAETIDAFDTVCLLLRQNGIAYTIDETLVRGLDYYTATAFELDFGDASRALAAGGRYSGVIDGVSGVGFAIGLERVETVLETMDDVSSDDYNNNDNNSNNNNVVFVIALGNETRCTSEVMKASCKAVKSLRKAGVSAVLRSEIVHVSKCVSRAVRDGACAVVTIGSDEIAKGLASVKIICESKDWTKSTTGAAESVDLDIVGDYVREQLQRGKENRHVVTVDMSKGDNGKRGQLRQSFENN